MVLEAILYFVLGFLGATLLALMVSPAIWNRAVVLTKKKIESSVPLSLNEIQADKDQLRAEFAMSTRRLEMSVDELKERAAEQLIEINRRRDEVNKLNSEGKERLDELKELEAKFEKISTRLEERETKLASLTDKQTRLQEEHDSLLEEAQKLRRDYSDTEQALKTKEIEASADKATIEALKGTVSTIDMSDNKQLSTINNLQEQLAESNERLKSEKLKAKEAIERAQTAESDLKTVNRKLKKNTQKIGAFQEKNANNSQSQADLTTQLIDEKTKTVELEAKLAKQALQMEALLNDASNENVQTAMRTLNSDLDEKSNAVQNLREERDRLASELEAIKADTAENWADERQEKAFMRQRINDLAAQVGAMTANIEGEASPINKILDAHKEKSDRGNAGTSGSLADRIRAVQQAANNQ